MRFARVKLDDRDMVYHVYNRTVGTRYERPFGDAEKDMFLKLMHRLSKLYVIDILAFAIMDNHFHLLLNAPCDVPSDAETCKRYAAHYQGSRELQPGSRSCELIARRLRDISWFMHDLQQQFSAWFNRSRTTPRRGYLWAGRFKSPAIETGIALRRCWSYVELNPLRAGLTNSLEQYRYSSYGLWCRHGTHPFSKRSDNRLGSLVCELLGVRNMDEMRREICSNARLLTSIREYGNLGDCARQGETGQALTFLTQAWESCRHWIDGVAVGRRTFVMDVMRAARGDRAVENHEPQAEESPPDDNSREILVCYQHLRRLPT